MSVKNYLYVLIWCNNVSGILYFKLLILYLVEKWVLILVKIVILEISFIFTIDCTLHDCILLQKGCIFDWKSFQLVHFPDYVYMVNGQLNTYENLSKYKEFQFLNFLSKKKNEKKDNINKYFTEAIYYFFTN